MAERMIASRVHRRVKAEVALGGVPARTLDDAAAVATDLSSPSVFCTWPLCSERISVTALLRH